MAKTNVSPLPKRQSEVVKLTAPRIERMAPRAKAYHVKDADQPGLQIRITPNGAKSFIWYRKVNGKPRRITLGAYPALTAADARNAARKLEAQRADGQDPAEIRSAARAANVTLEVLRNSWRDVEGKYLRSVKDLDAMWDRWTGQRLRAQTVSTLTPRQLEGAIQRVRNQGKATTANRLLAHWRALLNYAIRQQVVTTNPMAGIRATAERPRARVLSNDERGRLLQALEHQPQPWRSYFKLLIWTGQRRGAVEAMRWEDLDLAAGRWVVPSWASKNKSEMAVALLSQSVDALGDLPQISEWVFPSTGASGHIEEPRKAWARLCKQADIDGVRIHDLRRTVGTALAVAGVSAHGIKAALGHKSLQSAQAYVHLDTEAARAALERGTAGWGK
jgi:integrase